jgi:hypothetical protein
MSDSREQMASPANETVREIRATGRRWKIILSIGYGAFLFVVGVVLGYAHWALPPEIVRTQVFTDPQRIWTVLGGSVVVWLVLMGGTHLYVLYSVRRAKATSHDSPAATDPAEETRNFVCAFEGDEAAALAIARRYEIQLLSILGLVMALACFALSVGDPSGNKPSLSVFYVAPVLALVWLFAAVCFHQDFPRRMRAPEFHIGSDFIGVFAQGQHGFFRRFSDIRCVLLNMSKGRVTGAIILGKWGTMFKVTLVKDLTTLLRVLLEHTEPDVKWRRCFHPLSRFSRKEVKALIDAVGGGLDINTLLPPGSTYMSLDELMPPRAGPGRSRSHSIVFLSTTPPSPAHRYANLMLMKMSLDQEWTRTLRRCEELGPLSNGKETVEPPPFDDLVNRLKTMCGRKTLTHKEPIDASFNIGINRVPWKVLCHFDDQSDACCTIRMETEG